ncbi:hypothetical protein A2U01_0000796 [Trifolium medium]|uniref:Uncharacterized protein n=1 Tax=Trifolium medium TaxID=97028 RepID=A0A392M0D9_9FABA|nr:hypothetical protein [Trifolium medium]
MSRAAVGVCFGFGSGAAHQGPGAVAFLFQSCCCAATVLVVFTLVRPEFWTYFLGLVHSSAPL